MKIEPTTSEIIKIDSLFERKCWAIEQDKPLDISLYNKYIDRYARLAPETRDLFLKLSEKFTVIGSDQIYFMFKRAFEKIPGAFLNKFRVIYFYPLVKPYIHIGKGKRKVARPKVKSGQKIMVFIEVNEFRELRFSDKLRLPDDFNLLKEQFIADRDLLVLIDDFVGTGNTANEIFKELFELEKFNNNNTILLSLVAQERGVKAIKEVSGVETYYEKAEPRGLSDSFEGIELEQHKSVAGKMERSLKIPEEYHLGFEESEALVSIMNKSPNNTFPVFWYETKSLVAPFKREAKYRRK